MTRRRFAMTAACALGLSLLATTSATADDKNVTGTWKWSVTRNGEEMETVLKLKQEGDKLTGTVSGRDGQETAITDGTVKGDDVAFKVQREFNGNILTINFSAKLEGDTLTGKIGMTRDGETRERDWVAKRAE